MKYIEQKTRRKVNTKTVVVGIDVAKYEHVAVAQKWDGARMKPVKIRNEKTGIKKILEYIEESKKVFKAEKVKVALEPTGHYWQNLSEQIVKAGIEIEMIQPMHTHRAKEIEDNTPCKTDEKDAAGIADLATQGKGLKLVMPTGVYADLRYLTHYREELVKDKTRKLNQLHRIMDTLYPEYIKMFKGKYGKAMRELLKKAPTPEKTIKLGEQNIERILRENSRWGYCGERAKTIIRAAEESIGVKSGQEALEIRLKMSLGQIEIIEKMILDVESRIKEKLEEVPYAGNLRSIPRLGDITIATILGEAGDLRSYKHAKEIIKLSGLNLYEVSSGMHRGNKRITKRGRPMLRRIIFIAALRMF
jgi:transposase